MGSVLARTARAQVSPAWRPCSQSRGTVARSTAALMEEGVFTVRELRLLGRRARRALRGAHETPAQMLAKRVAKRTRANAKRLAKACSVAVGPSRSEIHVESDSAGMGVALALDTIPSLAGCVVHEAASDKDPLVRHVISHNFPDVKNVCASFPLQQTDLACVDLYYLKMPPCTAAAPQEPRPPCNIFPASQ